MVLQTREPSNYLVCAHNAVNCADQEAASIACSLLTLDGTFHSDISRFTSIFSFTSEIFFLT